MDRYERKLAESARILTARAANTTNITMSHGSVHNERVREQPTLLMFSSVFCPMPIGYRCNVSVLQGHMCGVAGC